MGKRRKSRELALQMLFQADLGQQNMDRVRKTFWNERSDIDEATRGFADDLVRVASDELDRIDTLIQKHAQHWRVESVAAVERTVVRAGVAEFLAYPQAPKLVVINEALEVARK